MTKGAVSYVVKADIAVHRHSRRGKLPAPSVLRTHSPPMLNWLRNKLPPADDMSVTMESHSGIGTLSCNDCGHAEEAHLFTHGFGPTSHCTMGCQCQSCAKFVTFDSEPVGEQGLPALKALIEASRCECGGRYAKDKPIMCARCKSRDVGYELREIT